MAAGHLDLSDVARITSTMALKKIATPKDVAAQVVALTSPTISGHVTGQVVTVAGGMEGRLLHPSKPALGMTRPSGRRLDSSAGMIAVSSGQESYVRALTPPRHRGQNR
jgi:hypothetical protein